MSMLRTIRTLLLACAVAIGIFLSAHLLPPLFSGAAIAPAAAATAFVPPDTGKPDRIEGAGTRFFESEPTRRPSARDRDVIVGGQKLPCPLTAYVPESEYGLTARAYPTFLIHVPELPDDTEFTAEFFLVDLSDRTEIYRTKFPIVHRHRTIAIELPDNANVIPLKAADRTNPDNLETPVIYEWTFALTRLDDADGLQSTAVTGRIERINLVENFANALHTASKNERVDLYAETGIWYDAIATLYELRREKPNDLRLRLNWEKMLGSVKLADIAKKQVF